VASAERNEQGLVDVHGHQNRLLIAARSRIKTPMSQVVVIIG